MRIFSGIYEVHKFKYSSQKSFSLHCVFIVLLLNEKLFLATVFEFVYVITALVFSTPYGSFELPDDKSTIHFFGLIHNQAREKKLCSREEGP